MSNKYCGTYKPCENCTTADCCLGKHIDLVIVTIDELKNISLVTGIPENELVIEEDSGKNVFRLKSNTNGECYFYINNECTIYENRPADCRIFPFDIKADDEEGYNLVLYSSVCPDGICSDKFMSFVDHVIEEVYPHIKPYINEYILPKWSQHLKKQNYIVVKKLS